MRYEISGGTFPVVTCGLANGEQMITEGVIHGVDDAEHADGD